MSSGFSRGEFSVFLNKKWLYFTLFLWLTAPIKAFQKCHPTSTESLLCRRPTLHCWDGIFRFPLTYPDLQQTGTDSSCLSGGSRQCRVLALVVNTNDSKWLVICHPYHLESWWHPANQPPFHRRETRGAEEPITFLICWEDEPLDLKLRLISFKRTLKETIFLFLPMQEFPLSFFSPSP